MLDSSYNDPLADQLLGQLTEDFFQRHSRGENPQVEEYAERYPEIAELIRDLFPLLELINAAENQTVGGNNSVLPDIELQQLGDFRLLRELGRGGMGVVYEAQQMSMNRRVALKILPFASLLESSRLKRFRNEVLAAASLDHSNIVSVYSVGEERGIHYYAMQLVRGPTLASLIEELKHIKVGQAQHVNISQHSAALSVSTSNMDYKQDEQAGAFHAITTIAACDANETQSDKSISTIGKQSTREFYRNVGKIGIQIADALEHAHRQGVLHRDIKPANILLDETGKPYITDFGMAQVENNTTLTLTGDLLGTLRYMSPEQATGGRVVDPRSDIYSLGVTLYELLTLSPAFPETDRKRLINQVLKAEPLTPRKLDRSIPTDLQSIVLKAMSENAADRYSSAQDLRADLQRFVDGKPVLAKPTSLLAKVTKWSSRNPAIVASMIAMLLVTSIAALASNYFLRREWLRAENANDTANRQTQKATQAADSAKAINRFLTEFVMAGADPARSNRESEPAFRDALDNASDYADQWFPKDPALRSTLYRTIAQLYDRLGELPLSEEKYRQALKLIELDDEAINDRCEIMNGLGKLLGQQGQVEQAEEMLRQCLAIEGTALSQHDPLTIATKINLANILAQSNKLQEAESLAKQSLESAAQLYGNDHPVTASASIACANVLLAREERTVAEPILRKAVAVLKEVSGSQDLLAQQAMCSLAEILQQRNELEAAEELHREVLQARIRLQGNQHSLTAQAMLNLSDVLMEQQQYPEVESLLRQILQTQLLSTDTAFTLHRTTVAKLTDVLWKQGRLTEAIGFATSVPEAATLEADPSLLDGALQYADILCSVGNYAEAENLLRTSWETAKEKLGINHPISTTCVTRLLFTIFAQRKLNEDKAIALPNLNAMGSTNGPGTWFAEMMALKSVVDRSLQPYVVTKLEESLKQKRSTLPPFHLSTATTLSIFAQNLMSLERAGEAEPLLRESLEIRLKSLPAGHWLIAETRNILGECLTHLGQFAEAEEQLLASCQKIDQYNRLNAAHKAEWLERVCNLYEVWDKAEQTRSWNSRLAHVLGECLDDWKSWATATEGCYMEGRCRYAKCLTMLGRYEEAERILLEICALRDTTASWLSDPYSTAKGTTTLRARHALLVNLYERWGKIEESNDWKNLIQQSPNEASLASLGCHRQGIKIWQDACGRQDNPLLTTRLARAYLDAANYYLRVGPTEQALLGARKSIATVEPVLHAEPYQSVAAHHRVLARLSLAAALNELGQFSEASSCYEAALAEATDLPTDQFLSKSIATSARQRVYVRFAWFLASCPDIEVRNPERVLTFTEFETHPHMLNSIGLAHYQSGDYPATIELLKQGQRSTIRFCLLAMAYYFLDDHAAALFHLNLAKSHTANREVRNGDVASIAWEDDRTANRMLEHTAKVLQVPSTEVDAISAYWKGKAQFEYDQFEQASESFRTAIEIKPDYPEPYLGLGETLLALRPVDAQSAVLAARRYFELVPESPIADAYELLGRAEDRLGEFDKAVEALERAVALRERHGNPSAYTHYQMYRALSHRGDIVRAVENLDRAIELSPDDPFLRDRLAWLFAVYPNEKYRNPNRAVELAQQAVNLKRDDAEYWTTLGIAHYRNGEFVESRSAVDAAMERTDGGSVTEWLFIAMCDFQLGSLESAQEWYDKAVQWRDQHPTYEGPNAAFFVEAEELLQRENATNAQEISRN